MKHTGIILAALGLVAPAIFAACASGSETQNVGGMGGGDVSSSSSSGVSTTSSSGNTTTSSSSSGTTSSGTMCVQHCTSDADCQNSCPAPSTGQNCCDTSTGICYTVSQSACPASTSTSSSSSGSYP